MDLSTIAIVAGMLLTYSQLSGRLAGTMLTALLLFVAFGFVVGV